MVSTYPAGRIGIQKSLVELSNSDWAIVQMLMRADGLPRNRPRWTLNAQENPATNHGPLSRFANLGDFQIALYPLHLS
jgi:hypothetical protein